VRCQFIDECFDGETELHPTFDLLSAIQTAIDQFHKPIRTEAAQ
jgi:hypothetical protein